jgi:hypothetical protein
VCGASMKVTIDPDSGIGLCPGTIDLADLVDPNGVWETAEAALAANPDAQAQHTQCECVDGAEALGRLLLAAAAELRSLDRNAS